jgi:hypothetical protein
MLAGLAVEREQELAQELDAREGEFSCGVQMELRGQCVESALKRITCVGEGVKAGIAAELGGCAKNADGAELFEYVRVAEERGLDAMGLVMRLMFADTREHGGDFIGREAERGEKFCGAIAGVRDVVPCCERGWILWAMPDEDAEIVQIGGGEDNVIIVGWRRFHQR